MEVTGGITHKDIKLTKRQRKDLDKALLDYTERITRIYLRGSHVTTVIVKGDIRIDYTA